MLDLVPVTLAEANAFVEQKHRHHGKTAGHKFSVAVADTETKEIVGVAIVGRPASRFLDDGWTLEVNRLCTDGTKTPVQCCMRRRGVRPALWDTRSWLHTFLTAKMEPA